MKCRRYFKIVNKILELNDILIKQYGKTVLRDYYQYKNGIEYKNYNINDMKKEIKRQIKVAKQEFKDKVKQIKSGKTISMEEYKRIYGNRN
jgi:hypothetical protein